MKLIIAAQAVDQNHSTLGFFVKWFEVLTKL